MQGYTSPAISQNKRASLSCQEYWWLTANSRIPLWVMLSAKELLQSPRTSPSLGSGCTLPWSTYGYETWAPCLKGNHMEGSSHFFPFLWSWLKPFLGLTGFTCDYLITGKSSLFPIYFYLFLKCVYLESISQRTAVGFFFFWLFGHTMQLVGSQFPNQGLNPRAQQWKPGILTTRLPGNSQITAVFIEILLWFRYDEANSQELIVIKKIICYLQA